MMKNRNFIVILSHPDDESMFFLPTIAHILNENIYPGGSVHILCLSNGNYDNLGLIREKELKVAALVISNRIKTTIINDTRLQDGPKESWPPKLIGKILQDYISEQNMKNATLITFDKHGVSGHPNHIDTFRGVRDFYFSRKEGTQDTLDLDLWSLHSEPNPIKKFFPIVDIFRILIMWFLNRYLSRVMCNNSVDKEDRITCTMFNPVLVWKAMKAHHSQFVWYRRLFVVFSRYSYVNNLAVYGNKTGRQLHVKND